MPTYSRPDSALLLHKLILLLSWLHQRLQVVPPLVVLHPCIALAFLLATVTVVRLCYDVHARHTCMLVLLTVLKPSMSADRVANKLLRVSPRLSAL